MPSGALFFNDNSNNFILVLILSDIFVKLFQDDTFIFFKQLEQQ